MKRDSVDELRVSGYVRRERRGTNEVTQITHFGRVQLKSLTLSVCVSHTLCRWSVVATGDEYERQIGHGGHTVAVAVAVAVSNTTEREQDGKKRGWR